MRTPRERDAAVCIALVALVACVFGQTLRHDFVGYDDPIYVTDNPLVQRGITAEGVKWAFARGGADANYWTPVTFLSHMLDAQLWGSWAGGHHLTSTALHAINSVLLYLVLVAMTKQRWPSALAAALFAVHPLHVESVAWIAERKDLLSGMFLLLCIGTYVWWVRRGSVARYVVVLAMFALAVMSKPMVVTLPAVLLVLDCWPLKRPARWGRLIVEKIPFVVLAGVISVVTVLAQSGAGTVRSLGQFSFGFRVANAIVSYARYLQKTLWPVNLAVFYPPPDHWPPGIVLLCAALLAGITIVTLLLRRRTPYLLAGWLIFGGMLLPVIGILQVGRQAMADRYSYLPHVGIFIAIAWLAAEVRNRRAMTVVAAIVTVALAARAADQTRHWMNTDTLFEHAQTVTPENAVVLNQLGNARARAKNLPEAEAFYRRALELDPDYGLAHLNLGSLLARRRDFASAADHFEAALRWRSDLPRAQLGLAVARTGLRQYDLADRAFAEALRLSPGLAEAEQAWGSSLKERGSPAEAAEHFRAALKLNPQLTIARQQLAEIEARPISTLPTSRP